MFRRGIALVLLPLVLTACSYNVKLPTEGLVDTTSPAPSTTPSELPADALQVSIIQTNNSYTKTKYWSVIAYPEFSIVSGPETAQAVVADIDERVAQITEGFTAQAKSCYDPATENSSLNITARPDFVSQRLYVVQLEIAQYFCGAVRGDDFFETHAFDVETGDRVDLSEQLQPAATAAFESLLADQLTMDFPDSTLAQTLLKNDGWSLLEGAAWWPAADGLHVLVQGTPASYMDGTSCELVLQWPSLKGKINPRSVVGEVFAAEISA